VPASLNDLIDPATMFDRAGELTPHPRKTLGHDGPVKTAVFEVQAAHVRIHPELRGTPVWAYDGSVPGPTVVVDAGDRVHVRVRNTVHTALPYEHAVVDDGDGTDPAMNRPGTDGLSADAADKKEREAAEKLTACCVLHLHGAPTPPDSDGWAENVRTPGEAAHHHFQFDREAFGEGTAFGRRGGAAPMFWYHDHAMGATRFNNFAGLAGVWLVRDPLEQALGLPTCERYELPLVIQDRNLQTHGGTASGPLDGKLLHKVQRGVRECFGPATLVSGKLWPRVNVEPRVYRLRLLNGSNARFYRLHFYGLTTKDDLPGTPLDAACVQQIGTDGGLLGRAVDLPNGAALLAPAERADVLIDFGLVAASFRHVVVYNSAAAPFPDKETDPVPPTPRPDFLRPVPQVLRFDLAAGTAEDGLGGKPIRGMALDPDFEPLPEDHQELPRHDHSLVVLREEEMVVRGADGNPVDAAGNPTDDPTQMATRAMLFVHEMMREADADRVGMNMYRAVNDLNVRQGIRLTLPAAGGGTEAWVTAAKRFTDATTIFIEKEAWHMWRVLNLSPDAHPFHIHLTQLQVLSRQLLKPPVGAENPAAAGFEFDLTGPTDPATRAADDAGWKDTFRSNPGDRPDPAADLVERIGSAELLTIFGQFKQHAGRYMYHCHILEHEDADMMRPFVVLPGPLMRFMAHGGMAHHTTTEAPKAGS
jgi:spore coat protein A